MTYFVIKCNGLSIKMIEYKINVNNVSDGTRRYRIGDRTEPS